MFTDPDTTFIWRAWGHWSNRNLVPSLQGDHRPGGRWGRISKVSVIIITTEGHKIYHYNDLMSKQTVEKKS